MLVMLRRDIRVEDAKLLDHRAVWIGEQWKGDGESLGKCCQHVARIIADGTGPDALLGEGREMGLQFDQLRLAKTSPGSAAVEEDESLILAADLPSVVNWIPLLIREHEIGDEFADIRPFGELLGPRITRIG